MLGKILTRQHTTKIKDLAAKMEGALGPPKPHFGCQIVDFGGILPCQNLAKHLARHFARGNDYLTEFSIFSFQTCKGATHPQGLPFGSNSIGSPGSYPQTDREPSKTRVSWVFTTFQNQRCNVHLKRFWDATTPHGLPFGQNLIGGP